MSKQQDKERKAKPKGYRFKGEGNNKRPLVSERGDSDVYYEGRKNRSDKNLRKKLEQGGGLKVSSKEQKKEDLKEIKKFTKEFEDNWEKKYKNILDITGTGFKLNEVDEFIGGKSYYGFPIKYNAPKKSPVGDTQPERIFIAIGTNINHAGVGDGQEPNIARTYTIDFDITGKKRYTQRSTGDFEYGSWDYARTMEEVLEKFNGEMDKKIIPYIKNKNVEKLLAKGGEVDEIDEVEVTQISVVEVEEMAQGGNIDRDIKAKPRGWRFSGKDDYRRPKKSEQGQPGTYYEDRKNRSDKNLTKKLEDGGTMEKGGGAGNGKNKTKTITVFSFDDLSPEAKKVAINHERDLRYSGGQDYAEWAVGAVDDDYLFEPKNDEIEKLFGKDFYTDKLNKGKEYTDTPLIGNTRKNIYFDTDRNRHLDVSNAIVVNNDGFFLTWLGLSDELMDKVDYKIEPDSNRNADTIIEFEPSDSDYEFTKEEEKVLGDAKEKFSDHMGDVLKNIETSIESNYEDEAIIEHFESNEYEFMEDGSKSEFSKGGSMETVEITKEQYQKALSDYNKWGAHLDDEKEEGKEENKILEYRQKMRDAENIIHRYERSYSSGGSMEKGGEVGGIDVDEVVRHFIISGLWASYDDNEENLDRNYGIEDVSSKSVKEIKEKTIKFLNENIDILKKLKMSEESIGHDLFLDSQGHGAGFWDRGYGEDGNKLSKSAKKIFPSDQPYVGDDKKIYFYFSGGSMEKGGIVGFLNTKLSFWELFD